MKKQVAFYPNHPDNMHCVLAIFRSLFDYFFNEKLSWKQIEKKMGFVKGKGAWTFPAETELAKRGMEVINIEPFDYKRFLKEGEDYLRKAYNQETANYYLHETNINTKRNEIPEFIRVVKHQTRKATVDDIDNFLIDGYLVGAEINSRILNKKPGFSLHYVLIKRLDDDQYVINDPGLPPLENRKVTRGEFMEALGREGTNGEVTAFRYPTP